ncbi:MAG: DUF885 domain-containing protein [Candidatus Aminicenantales bacterium]
MKKALLTLLVLLLSFSWTAAQPVQAPAAGGSYDDLVALFKEFREFQKPKVTDGVPDYTPAAMKVQRLGLDKLMKRLAAIDIKAWPISQKVDYMLVRAEMNGLDFDHRVLKPWAKDPAWYIVVEFQFGQKMYDPINLPRGPLNVERIPALKAKLKAVPAILEQAKKNLTGPTADLVMLGIRSKQREAGMLREFAKGIASSQPDLVPDVERAIQAVDDFRGWLEQNQSRWKGPSGIGIANYDWYLKNVQLLPYSWEELMAISQREYDRAMAMIRLEQHKNRALPPFKLVSSSEEYAKIFNESQKFLRNFLVNEDVMTVPDWLTLDPIKGFYYNFKGVPDYFAQIQLRDSLPLQPHDFVGHNPDAYRQRQDKRPIRGTERLYFIDGTRAEALAAGSEEILMHLGLLDQRPRARELTYNLLGFRAARSMSDLWIHSNQLTFQQGYDYNIDKTPYHWLPADSPTMWHDLELYLRQPTYGVGYLIGSLQLQKLISDRGIQLEEKFVLKDLMDSFYASGMVPIALIRWEITGLDDEILKMWPEYAKLK